MNSLSITITQLFYTAQPIKSSNSDNKFKLLRNEFN